MHRQAILILALSSLLGAQTMVLPKTIVLPKTELLASPLVVPPSPAQTPFDCGAFATNPTCTATSGSNATAGNVLIAYMWGGSALTAFNTPTGCASSWTLVQFDSGSAQVFYIGTVASTGACSVVGSETSSGTTVLTLVVYEIVHAIATVDQQGFTASLGSCSSCTGTAVTTTVANDFVATFTDNCTGTITVNAPYTLGLSNNPVGNPVMTAYDTVAVTGSTAATWTSSGGCVENATIAVEP